MTEKRRARRSPAPKKNGAAKAAPVGTLGDALVLIERERQSAALLKHAAELVIHDFATEGGPPRYVLMAPSGATFDADVDLVLRVAQLIHQLAHESQTRAQSLLNLPVKGVRPPEKDDEAGDQKQGAKKKPDRFGIKVIANPRRKKKPTPRAVA